MPTRDLTRILQLGTIESETYKLHQETPDVRGKDLEQSENEMVVVTHGKRSIRSAWVLKRALRCVLQCCDP